MLRDNKVIKDKPVIADYVADKAMKTGMAVLLNDTDKKGVLPAEATASNIYFVDKERIPTGVWAARNDYSDYADIFVDVAAGEGIKLKHYLPGEEFFTDQIVKGTVIGKVLVASTTGQLAAAAGNVASRYKYVASVADNGHTLAQIRVLDDAITNA